MKKSRNSQLALEFVLIVAVLALALSFSAGILASGFSNIERASLEGSLERVSSFASFSRRSGGTGQFGFGENMRVFPTGEVAVFSEGDLSYVSACGRFSGFRKIPLGEGFSAGGAPLSEKDCLKGKFSNGRGFSGKVRVSASSEGGKSPSEISISKGAG